MKSLRIGVDNLLTGFNETEFNKYNLFVYIVLILLVFLLISYIKT